MFALTLLAYQSSNAFVKESLALSLPNAATYTQQARLIQTDGSHDDRFGTSVAVSGDTAVVGAYLDDFGASNEQGSAYVFVRSGSTWTFQAKLVASDGAALDRFGFSVSISGDTIVVGSYFDDNGRGSAYVFVRSGSNWTQQAKLAAADGAANDQFGWRVAVSGETAIVGAHLDAVNGAGQGSAYIFTRSGTNWTQQQKLTASDGAANDRFGISVSISGETAVVGSISADVGSNLNQGAAYVFTKNGTSWTQQQKLTANDGAPNDNFGNAVAVSGDTVIAGAFAAGIGSNTDRGAAYVFARNGANWSQQAKLVANDSPNEIFFATGVALDGNTAIVGSPYTSIAGNINRGSAYVFTRSGTAWSQQLKILAADGSNGDFFGASVAVDGSTVAAGAAEDEVGTNIDQGAAYIFKIAIETARRAPADFDGDGKTDIAVFRPGNGVWYFTNSSNNQFRAVQFGTGGDVITPGDFDGDSRADFAVFRQGVWWVLQSSNNQFYAVQFGIAEDKPVAADYDGDGKTDIAVFRQGVWYILQSSNNQFRAVSWGLSDDLPAPRDYDGDNKADIAVYRSSSGTWYVLKSSDGNLLAAQFGTNGDKPVAGDYDNDGRTDFAVYRPNNGVWYVLQTTAGFRALQFGSASDVPAQGDFDGDGRTDFAVYRPSEGNWYVSHNASGAFRAERFGSAGDVPVSAGHNPVQ